MRDDCLVNGVPRPCHDLILDRPYAPSERAFAQLKGWKALRQYRGCPTKDGDLVRAVLVLHRRENLRRKRSQYGSRRPDGVRVSIDVDSWGRCDLRILICFMGIFQLSA